MPLRSQISDTHLVDQLKLQASMLQLFKCFPTKSSPNKVIKRLTLELTIFFHFSNLVKFLQNNVDFEEYLIEVS